MMTTHILNKRQRTSNYIPQIIKKTHEQEKTKHFIMRFIDVLF